MSQKLSLTDHLLLFSCEVSSRTFRLFARMFPSIRTRSGVLGGLRFQPFLQSICKLKAHAVFVKAKKTCPAYKDFLSKNIWPNPRWADVSNLPETTKDNYVRAYSIEDRCYGGAIPRKGVVIDESSGSSGTPNNWVRGLDERRCVKALMEIAYQLKYGSEDFMLLNCFALGPWATGMNVSMSMADSLILKSIGPDKAKLENTLKLFGDRYRYLISGYPPFVKDFLNSTELNLAEMDVHLIVGGEGMTEGLRDYFLESFKSVYSSFGASDLEINIAAETDFTVALRRLCFKDSALCQAMFGRNDAPMIFQYNPLDYVIETNDDGELIFTIARLSNIAPKIRYNLRDFGGTVGYADALDAVTKHGHNVAALKHQRCFPLLYLFGRSDLTVSFYGANIYTSDLDHIIHQAPDIVRLIHSFHIKVEETSEFEKQLRISLERTQQDVPVPDLIKLRDVIFESLQKHNQDFREVSKMFSREQFIVDLHDHATGPFANRDIRLKNSYIG